MSQHHAHEGADAHTHPHSHAPQSIAPMELGPTLGADGQPFNMNEAVAMGAQEWLAREFVGGLLAIADAQQIDRAEFLSEKCLLLAHRLANAESESRVQRTQLQALVTENGELHRKIDDCGCHEDQIADNDPRLEGLIPPGTGNGETP